MKTPQIKHYLKTLPFGEMLAHCRYERQQYQQNGQTASPVTVALIQQALHHDPTAQNAICELFAPQVKSWIGSQQKLDPEDIAQQAWLQFWRYAPNTPNLTNTNDLGAILLYLRRCVKSTILMAARKHKTENSLDDIAELPEPTTLEQESILRLTIRECVERGLQNEDERTIFRWRFEWEATPQEIVAHHRERFPSIDDVYQIIQRLTRRLRNDATLQQLVSKPARLRQKLRSPARPSLQLSPTG